MENQSNVIRFGTKADTLAYLESRIRSAIVLPQLSSTIEHFVNHPEAFWDASAQPLWLSKPVIVRSSSKNEDAMCGSNAGKYESVRDVHGKKAILEAIQKVIDSYDSLASDEQFFVQPMLENMSVSGVAFNQDPNSGGHYIVLNYDDHSASTDSVTAGTTNDLKLCYVAKNSSYSGADIIVDKIVRVFEELETLFGQQPIDIEFAIDKKGKLYLLQARPLIVNSLPALSLERQREKLDDAITRYGEMSGRHPYLLGEKAVFGVMPDWNPAEIIGTKPKPLSISLYRELITDNIWAYQRDNYGYRKLRSFPLMVDFHGLPYIDARISFNSFIPANLNENTAEKLVNYYLTRLENSPSLHDKVEFDIIFSCYSFDLAERLDVLKQEGFNACEISEIFEALKSLSNNIVNSDGLWKKDIEKIAILESKQSVVVNSELSSIDKIYWLLEDCKRYGTLPFAGLARAGFIAVQMLNSMVAKQIISQQEREFFLRSLDTISTSMSRDLVVLDKSQFLKKYGHLRPGTYDLLSKRYDESPDHYFDWQSNETKTPDAECSFAVRIESLNELNEALKKDSINQDAIGMFNFIRAAIEGREYAKFVFSKSLSDALSLVSNIAESRGISVEDSTYLDINVIKENCISSRSFKLELNRNIQTGKERYEVTKQINLPPLILNESDFLQFKIPKNNPNYITQQSCAGLVAEYNLDRAQLKGKVLFIENADPGYDWIFSCGITGFITQYGGINSHMAIRASELGIPAVIGAGETWYKHWLKSEYLEIDCANKIVRTVR